MLDFLATHWPSILVVLVFIGVIVFLAVRGKKDIIYKMLYTLVTEAEKLYGSGTGSIKFAYVMEKIYGMLPGIIKVFITYDTLEKWIEQALTQAKEHWAKEAGILEKAE
jgi:hypothetical protein